MLFLRELTINDLTYRSPWLALPSPFTTLPFYLLALVADVSCTHSIWSYLYPYPNDLHLINLQISLLSLTYPPFSFFWSALLSFASHGAMGMLCSKTLCPIRVPKIHLLLSLSSSNMPIITVCRQRSGLLPLVFTKTSQEKSYSQSFIHAHSTVFLTAFLLSHIISGRVVLEHKVSCCPVLVGRPIVLYMFVSICPNAVN